MQVSVAFNPAVDNENEVLDTVSMIFASVGQIVGTKGTQGALCATIDAAAPVGTVATIAAAPVAAPAATAAVATPSVDQTGLPWDKRIHSDPAALTSKGVWRARRGAVPADVVRIEAELRGGAAPAPAPAAPIAPVVSAPVAAAPAAPMLAPIAPIAPAAPVMTPYMALIKLIGENLHSAENPAGRLSNEWVKQSLTAWNVPNGSIEALATADETRVQQIVDAIANALAC